KKKVKTYNSRDSPVVTHLTTSPPVRGLTCGERTGSSVLLYLWSYVAVRVTDFLYIFVLSHEHADWPPLCRKKVMGSHSTTAGLNLRLEWYIYYF
ncbi:hypothetical protein EJ02DRAFT_344672, partial [Clathrospora elynae]